MITDDAEKLLASAKHFCMQDDGSIAMQDVVDYLAQLLANLNGFDKQHNIEYAVSCVGDEYAYDLQAHWLALLIVKARLTAQQREGVDQQKTASSPAPLASIPVL